MTDLGTILYSLETALLDPAIRSSPEKIAEILSESFCEFTSSGKIYHYQKGDTFDISCLNGPKDWEILNFSATVLAKDIALASYTFIKHAEPDDSKKKSLRSSIWKNENGTWRILFHQGTPKEDNHEHK